MVEDQKDHSPTTPARPRRRRRRRRLRIAGLALAAVLLVGVGFGGFAYWKLNGNIRSVDVDSLLGRARPPASTNGDFNILLLGSDSRDGANRIRAGGASDGTARSDTAMVVHIARDHRRATVVSIPRDTLVERPACTKPDGSTVPGASRAMFNTAFEVGGAACAVETAESVTGLRMDHFVEIDFAGFADFIDAIGGVDVTTSVPMDDKLSRLKLAAGTHHLGGEQALAFVRTRHGVGDGSDLGRIELQQQMVKSILQQAHGAGLLANPVQLYRVADTLTRSITADSDLASVNALVGLSQTLKGIGPADLTAVTMPVRSAPSDPNRVEAAEPQASRVWAALKDDQVIPADIRADQLPNPADSPWFVPSPRPIAAPSAIAPAPAVASPEPATPASAAPVTPETSGPAPSPTDSAPASASPTTGDAPEVPPPGGAPDFEPPHEGIPAYGPAPGGGEPYYLPLPGADGPPAE